MRQLRVHYGTDTRGFFWPSSAQKRDEWLLVKRNKPAEAQAIYQCAPGEREGSIFLEADMAYYAAPADLHLGVESVAVKRFVERGHQVGVGWDTAFEAISTADFTAGLPALLMPCDKYHCGEDPAVFGPCDPHFDVLFLDMVYKQLDWAGLVPEFRRIHKRWEPYIHVVEKRGAGISLYQTMPLVGINVVGENPVENKRTRAIQGVGAGSVQGWFRQHRVLFPAINGELPEWVVTAITQLKDFSGAKDASDDIVDAIVYIVTYAIRLGGGAAMLPQGPEVERIIRESEVGLAEDKRAEVLAWLGNASAFSEDIFAHTCGRCNHYTLGFCPKFNRRVMAIDGIDCLEFDDAAN